MATSLFIIDDFLADPDAFRQKLLNLDYPERSELEVYPGRNSAQKVINPEFDKVISYLVDEDLKPQPQTGHGRARITLENELGVSDIHIDSCYWSGILYLSKPEDCMGGTDFFRHIDTGSDQATFLSDDLEKLGVTSVEKAEKIYQNILEQDGKDRSKWEQVMHVPMKYNRLVLLRPWLWHTAGLGFGNTIENGRLVYLLFFDSEKNN